MATALHGDSRPAATTGKCSTPRTYAKAPGDLDRGAVGGRLHTLVGRPTAGSVRSFQNVDYAFRRGGCCIIAAGKMLVERQRAIFTTDC